MDAGHANGALSPTDDLPRRLYVNACFEGVKNACSPDYGNRSFVSTRVGARALRGR
jgi:hypothetical protein